MKTKAIIVHTQILENYGDSNKPYWKPKGGGTYWVGDLELMDEGAFKDKTFLLNGMRNAYSMVETRTSSMFIEIVNDIEAISLEEAEERSSIPLDTEDSYLFFRRITKLGNHQLWHGGLNDV